MACHGGLPAKSSRICGQCPFLPLWWARFPLHSLCNIFSFREPSRSLAVLCTVCRTDVKLVGTFDEWPSVSQPETDQFRAVPSVAAVPSQCRRGKASILDCLLTILSRRKPEDTWPEFSFHQIREQVSALRLIEVPEASLRSVVYRQICSNVLRSRPAA